ncbi:MAG: flavin reductase family protein [Pseudonocardiales bacterium]|nr:flavin reductase family protein [Pseudonocardiales bacterium]
MSAMNMPMRAASAAGASAFSVDAPGFRSFFRHYASGVSVITACTPDGPRGLTATSVCALSLDPPLLLVCITRNSRTGMAIAQSGLFAVHLLRADQSWLCRRFSVLERDGSRKFERLEMINNSPVPLIANTFSWVVCERWAEYDGGDHTIIVGRLLESGRPQEESVPLIWFAGRSCYPESVHNRPDSWPVV